SGNSPEKLLSGHSIPRGTDTIFAAHPRHPERNSAYGGAALYLGYCTKLAGVGGAASISSFPVRPFAYLPGVGTFSAASSRAPIDFALVRRFQVILGSCCRSGVYRRDHHQTRLALTIELMP